MPARAAHAGLLPLAKTARRGLHDGGVYGRQVLRDFTLPDFSPEELAARAKQASLTRLVDSYRRHGHRAADLDPLKLTERKPVKALDPRRYGFAIDFELATEYRSDVLPEPTILDTALEHDPTGIFYVAQQQPWTIAEVTKRLQDVYTRALGYEYMHLPNKHEREWIAKTLETRHATPFSAEQRIRIWKLLEGSQAFDGFLRKRFATQKVYGLQGAESLIVALQQVFATGSRDGIREAVVSIAHRGRLNILATLLDFDLRLIFHKIRGQSELPDELVSRGFLGDVLSHLYASPTLEAGPKHDLAAPLTVHLLPNPSFLEAVNPVGMGLARALQVQCQPEDTKEELGDHVLNICIHGDGAWAGQGVVAETLNLQSLPHFTVGGTFHIVTNNQVGFTSPAAQGRSSFYATDLAKSIAAPIIHVNGDHPEEVARAVQLAMLYRKQFRKDVVIDLICYRRLGHNELDEPLMTNPLLYKAVGSLTPVAQLYEQTLLKDGTLTQQAVDDFKASTMAAFDKEHQAAEGFKPVYPPILGDWGKMQVSAVPHITPATGVEMERLREVGKASVETGDLVHTLTALPERGLLPSAQRIFPKLDKTHIQKRLAAIQRGEGIDFATAEALAFGSLMQDGFHIRLSGQESGRGTFSQRHALLADQEEERAFVPLNSLDTKGRLEVVNAPLSEFAVLGFEQGISWASPDILPIWEAQYGDFWTCAQVIVDTFTVSGEAKWGKQSALTLLLPHGADPGAGPEHSSARIERFLQLTNEPMRRTDFRPNVHICHPSTPAQLFHLLRRQMIRFYRTPLVAFTPKSILRLPAATSTLSEMASGQIWQPVLDDPSGCHEAETVVLLSGQLYYKLVKEREARGLAGKVALIRLEELSPFPYDLIERTVASYKNAQLFIFAQEEPENAGSLSFVLPRLQQVLRRRMIDLCCRPPMAAPAHGISAISKAEEKDLIDAILGA